MWENSMKAFPIIYCSGDLAVLELMLREMEQNG
jgi:hypothetical protein